MVRKKGNKKGRNDTDSDSDIDDGVAQKGISKPSAEKLGAGGLSRKQKRMEKLAGKSKGAKPSDQQDIQLSDPHDQAEYVDAKTKTIHGEKSKEVQKKAPKDQVSSSDEKLVDGGKRNQRRVIGKAKSQKNNKYGTDSDNEEDELDRESDDFQRIISDDSDGNKGNARMNKKKVSC
jgi:hypothetical protein